MRVTIGRQPIQVRLGGFPVSVDAAALGLLDAKTNVADLASTASGKGAALVGFLQSGTGAVARTAQDKLRDTVSVKDFGAIGDGVTDDTAAIQAAIDSVTAAGGTVNFPSGRYNVTSTLTVSSLYPVNLVGEMFGNISDIDAPCILIGAAMTYVVHYVGPDSPTDRNHGAGRVANLAVIDATNVSIGEPGTRTVTACLFLQDFALGVVENCTFHYIKGSAIKTEYAVQSTAKGCRIRYCGDTANPSRSAILMAGASTSYATQSFNIEDTRIEVCYSTYYVSADGANNYDVTVRGCHFEAAGDSFPASATTFIRLNIERYIIDGCTLNRTAADAVVIGSSGRGRIIGCTWVNAGESGRSLYLQGARNIVIGCIFEDNKTGRSIEIASTGVQNSLIGNAFYNSGAIYTEGRGTLFSDNTIIGPTATGGGYLITLGGTYAMCSGNRFDDNGSAPAVHGIVSYGQDQVTNNMFDRWSGKTCIRRENTDSVIEGNTFISVGTEYSQSVAPTTLSGPTVNGKRKLASLGNAEVIEFIGTPNASHTGSTATTTLATVTLPAGILGIYGHLEVIANWGATGTAGNKTGRILFGGTSISGQAFGATALSARTSGVIANNNSEGAQLAPSSQLGYGFGSSTSAAITPAVDTTAAVNIVFDGTLTNAADTIKLLSYIIRVHRRTA